jgi:hypothetical protein
MAPVEKRRKKSLTIVLQDRNEAVHPHSPPRIGPKIPDVVTHKAIYAPIMLRFCGGVNDGTTTMVIE